MRFLRFMSPGLRLAAAAALFAAGSALAQTDVTTSRTIWRNFPPAIVHEARRPIHGEER